MSTSPFNSPARPFFGRVESLRGLGALAVAGYHFAGCAVNGVPLLPDGQWSHADSLQNAIRQLGAAGLVAHGSLMVFFIISGFVLRLSLEHGPRHPFSATVKFLLGRAFRMYPIVVFGVIVASLIAEHSVSAREFFANAFLLDVSLNGTWWALQVELLMAPVIVALYFLERSRGPRVLMLIALVTSALAFKPTWAGWHPLSTNFFAFVLGMLLPTVGRKLVAGMSRRTAGVYFAFAVLALVLPNPCFGRYSKFSTVTEGYAAFALVSFVAYRQDLFVLGWLDVKPLRWLGMASGSYYVLHMLTIPLGLSIASALVPGAWSATAPALVGVLVLAVWLVAFAPLAVCSYYLIEAPGIALGRRVMRLLRLDAKPVPALAPIPISAEREAPRRAA